MILPLTQIDRRDADQAGRKAAALGELLRAGFPVPDGFCLAADAFGLALAPYQAAIDACLAQARPGGREGLLAAAAEIDRLLAALKIPPAVEAELFAAARSLAAPGTALAVRSSSPVEDLDESSFAGQYTSQMGVHTPEALRAAVISVWRSVFLPNSITGPAARMSVLVQPLLPAECAGVCFTLDPVDPSGGCLAITSTWGLGSGVVDGSGPVDTHWLRRADLSIDRQRIVEKAYQIALHPQGGVRRAPVDSPRRRAACLPGGWAVQVARLCLAVEEYFGLPQDVEWAIADGRVWLLQARPIASLRREKPGGRPFPVAWGVPEDRRRLWTLLAPGSGPLVPLELDYLALRESTRDTTCELVGADRHQDLRVVNGRPYTSPTPSPLSAADRRVRSAAMDDLADRLAAEGRTTWDYWGPEIEQANRRLAAFDFSGADGAALAGHLEEAMAVHRRGSLLHPLMRFKPPAAYFQAYSAVTGVTGAGLEPAAYRLLDMADSPLTRLLDGLAELAGAARDIPGAADWMADPPPGILARLETLPEAAGFLRRFADFLAEFGSRTGDGYGSEAGITTPTWREQPEQILRLAAPYLDPAAESPGALRKKKKQALEAEIQALCGGCPDSPAVTAFCDQLRYTRRVVAVIEEHNHHIEQTELGQLRRAVLASARWLKEAGALADEGQVFWLRFDEIVAALRFAQPVPLARLAAERRAAHREWEKMIPPPFLGTGAAGWRNPQLPARPPNQDDVTPPPVSEAGLIHGVGASQGKAEGKARVIRDPAHLSRLVKGEILVAENAGPLWTPYFPILAGLVLETGSLGQHAAVIAREYGIPAVFAVPNATRVIKDGDHLSIDGVLGTIELNGGPHRPARAG